jgi:hypothetical protein
MCKPSCCPGTSSSSGLGIILDIVAALAALPLVSAVVRVLAHSAALIAQAALVIAVALLVLALGVLVTVTIRARPARRLTPARRPGQLAAHRTPRAVQPPAPTWATAAITARIRTLSPPEQAKPAEVERWWP